MLVPTGKLTYRNLNTTYTHIDQFVTGLQKERFTGYCTVSFWEYDAVLLLTEGRILNGWEETGIRAKTVQRGDTAVTSILAKGHEKGGELNAYTLPLERVTMLVDMLDVTAKYENLSTDLTSLDKLMALLKKDALSGYIEILFEHEAGIANLFVLAGDLIESVWAPVDNRMLAEPMSFDEILALCQEHGAVFNVYQAHSISAAQGQGQFLQGAVPSEAIRLFEAILEQLETTIDSLGKAGAFQTEFRHTLPRISDRYEFLDPFLGDFRYTKHTLTYKGDAEYKEFVEGLCDAINSTLTLFLDTIPRTTLLPRLSTALETVTTRYPGLIDQLQLETRLPDLFQDYAFIQERETGETAQKQAQSRSVLNLQGIGVPEIGSDSILREFCRVIAIVVKKYTTSDGQLVQYTSLKKSAEHQQYQTATALLQNFDVSCLTRREDALAFWINLYNFLVIDGILKFGVTNVQAAKGFFTKTSYRLDEHLFSLDEIEHGILRNNRRRPYSVFRPFGGDDPRKAFCINPPDPRVHCCFACGARSSPALAIYTPKRLDQQFTQAVQRFLGSDSGMRIDRKKSEIWLNRTFYWYRKDFEQGKNTLLDFLLTNLEEGETKHFLSEHRSKLRIRFMDYDWSLNG